MRPAADTEMELTVVEIDLSDNGHVSRQICVTHIYRPGT